MDNSQRFDGYNRSRPLLAVDFQFSQRVSIALSDMFTILGHAAKASKCGKRLPRTFLPTHS